MPAVHRHRREVLVTRYPRDLVCRADIRGVVHYTLRTSFANQTILRMPALCEGIIDGGVILTEGPYLDVVTCLWCIAGHKCK